MTEVKRYLNIYLILGLIFLALEIGVRFSSSFLSENIKNIKEIPNISQQLYSQSKDVHKTILFLGNSLIGRALNLQQFKANNIGAGMENIAAFKITPDGTSIWDWYCISKNNIIKEQNVPTILVVGFAWGAESADPSRLAGFFCGLSDLPALVELGMDSNPEVFEFTTARISKLYALREHIHNKILDFLIPNYRVQTQKLNTLIRKKHQDENNHNDDAARNNIYISFLELLSGKNIKPIFVAMPVVDSYKLDNALVTIIERYNGVVLDYRSLKGIKEYMFVDPIHLDEQGSDIFTKQITKDLSVYLK